MESLLETGRIVLNCSRNENGTWNIFQVPSFMTHTRYEEIFDEARLDLIVENSKKRRRAMNATIFIGHNGFLGSDSKTAVVGDVRNQRRHGQVLFSDWLRVRPAVACEIDKGSYRQRSVELDPHDLNAIEGIALLGKEQPYFPFAEMSLDLTDEQRAQMQADAEADTTFHFARTSRAQNLYQWSKPMKTKAKKLPKLFVKNDKGRLVNFILPELFTKDGKGKATKFEITPEDADSISAMVEEKMAPLVEQVGVLIAQKVEGPKADEEEDGADDAGDEEDTELNADEGDEEEESDEEDDSEDEDADGELEQDAGDEDEGEEEEGEEEEQPSKPPKKKPAAVAATRSKIENAAETLARTLVEKNQLKGEKSRETLRKKISAYVDPLMHADADEVVEELVENAVKLDGKMREAFLRGIEKAYKHGGVPKGKLPSTAGTQRVGDVEQRAKTYYKTRADKGLMPFNGMKREDFVKWAKENPEDFSEIE